MKGWAHIGAMVALCTGGCFPEPDAVEDGGVDSSSVDTTPNVDTAPSCSPPCANGGLCTSGDGCACVGGWTGPTCEVATCSGGCVNGACDAPEQCICASGWTGPSCAEPECDPPCANGACTETDQCTCEDGWSGPTCSVPTCETACLNGGVCVAPDECDCTTGWRGPACGQPICSPACQNDGVCSEPNTCTCVNDWKGPTCAVATCDPACMNGGACVAPDVCECASGWDGDACEEPVCDPACGNGGTCTGPNACTCVDGWSGPGCALATCEPTCVNGSCDAPDSCSCVDGWTGPACAIEAVCGGVSCPGLDGYTASCNDADHCEYVRDAIVEPWHSDDVWIFVPPGTFPMGAPASETEANANERPVHDVTFAVGYFIAKYEVTISIHEACVAGGACTNVGGNNSLDDDPLHPKTDLNWFDAGDVCAWLGARRATEAEWEYAAKGPDTHRKYPWGDTPEPTCDLAGFFECGELHQVGSMPEGASPVGAMDMAGNAGEWVEDCAHPTYAGAPDDGSAWTADCTADRIDRGSSFGDPAINMRTARRYAASEGRRSPYTGIRCARSVE